MLNNPFIVSFRETRAKNSWKKSFFFADFLLGGNRHVGVLDGHRDFGPELLLAGLGTPQGVEQVLELILTVRGPQERLIKKLTVKQRISRNKHKKGEKLSIKVVYIGGKMVKLGKPGKNGEGEGVNFELTM